MEKGKAKRGDDVGDEEERKVEEFFALMRSFQEARNRRMGELNESERNNAKSRRLNEEKSSWVPTFEWQDFKEDICFRKSPLVFPAPRNDKKKKRQQQQHQAGDDGLDLKLTL